MRRGEGSGETDAGDADRRDDDADRPAGSTGGDDRPDRDPDGVRDSNGEDRDGVEDHDDGAPEADDPATEGWWRYPVATWLGLLTLPVGFVIAGAAAQVDYAVLAQLLGFVGTLVLAPSALAFGLGWFLSVGTAYWGSRHYREDPATDWNPNPTLYLVVALVGIGFLGLGPLLVGGAWFVQRVRNVGRPDLSVPF